MVIKQKISKEIRLLGDLLGEVISELSGPQTLEKEEEIRALSKAIRSGREIERARLKKVIRDLDLEAAENMALAFTCYFELINLAEENHRIERLNESRAGSASRLKESFHHAFFQLVRKAGQKDAQALMKALNIHLVFTAHPTEVKRRTILNKIVKIASLLENSSIASLNDSVRSAIKVEIASLWETSRSRETAVRVEDEVESALWYFENCLFDAVQDAQKMYESAADEYGLKVDRDQSWITFGSWIGGDRDGHPKVTSTVTRHSLRMAAEASQRRVQFYLLELAGLLSLHEQRDFCSSALKRQLSSWEGHSRLREFIENYRAEPYRCYLLCLKAILPELSRAELQEHLQRVETSYQKTKIVSVLGDIFKPLQRHLNVFGLHTVSLDLRQESSVHEKALQFAFKSLKVSANYSTLGEEQKLKILKKAFRVSPPCNQNPELRGVLASLEALKEADPAARGLYIISMTESLSDMIEVLLFMKWAKVSLPIVPLLETRKDLQNGRAILKEAWRDPLYRKHLQSFSGSQIVMLGYSDSNKDAGYATANWEIYRAQDEIASEAEKARVKLSFFHGRGGSIARGGGPAGKAIQSQSIGLRSGKIRITEQGEVLSSRYLRLPIAVRILEQLSHGSLLASADAKLNRKSKASKFSHRMQTISQIACDQYRALLQEKHFIEFWKSVTPIEFIKQLKIGSRPASRRAVESVEHLRAIPWVFSWLQTRAVLPGWFGLGTGLQHSGSLSELKQMYQEWPFFENLINNAQMSLAKADMGIARLYVDLFPQREVAEEIFRKIEEEYRLTKSLVLKVVEAKRLLDQEPTLQKSIELRNPYVDPLNFIQAEMMRRYQLEKSEKKQKEILKVMEICISGISAGLRNSG